MSDLWKLDPITFSPAVAAELTGVLPGTQRQWWNRGLLGQRTGLRAQVTLRDAIGMVILADCQPAKVGLKTVAAALPALTGSALFKLATDTVPWAFYGTDEDRLQFTSWFTEQEQRGSEHIVRMLDLRWRDLRRYMAVSSTGTESFDNIDVLADSEHRSIVLLLDSWGFASRLRDAIKADLFTVTRRSQRKE